jgi:SAM-dependent methyltransferase
VRAEHFHLNSRIESRHWWFVGRRRILRDVAAQVLAPDPRALVVDVGCGTGANIAAFARDYACVGIDPSADAIAWARQRFPGVRFVCGVAPDDIEETLRDARLVLLADVLEHVPDDFALLSRLVAAVRPGTLFLMTVPADMALWSRHDVSHGHYRRYDRDRFERLWRDMPLDPILVSFFNARLYGIIRAVRTVNRVVGRSSGEVNTDLRVPPAPVNLALERLFAGERRALTRAVGSGRSAYRRGVSCLALLRRGEGECPPVTRPRDVAPDMRGSLVDGTVR